MKTNQAILDNRFQNIGIQKLKCWALSNLTKTGLNYKKFNTDVVEVTNWKSKVSIIWRCSNICKIVFDRKGVGMIQTLFNKISRQWGYNSTPGNKIYVYKLGWICRKIDANI